MHPLHPWTQSIKLTQFRWLSITFCWCFDFQLTSSPLSWSCCCQLHSCSCQSLLIKLSCLYLFYCFPFGVGNFSWFAGQPRYWAWSARFRVLPPIPDLNKNLESFLLQLYWRILLKYVRCWCSAAPSETKWGGAGDDGLHLLGLTKHSVKGRREANPT